MPILMHVKESLHDKHVSSAIRGRNGTNFCEGLCLPLLPQSSAGSNLQSTTTIVNQSVFVDFVKTDNPMMCSTP